MDLYQNKRSFIILCMKQKICCADCERCALSDVIKHYTIFLYAMENDTNYRIKVHILFGKSIRQQVVLQSDVA